MTIVASLPIVRTSGVQSSSGSTMLEYNVSEAAYILQKDEVYRQSGW